MKIKVKQIYLLGAILVFIAILALLYGVISGMFVKTVPPGKYDSFAKCLTQKGVVMYGSYLCGYCNRQKEMFGDSFKYINYVECHPNGPNANPQLCTEKRIRGVPTWEIDGNLHSGLKSLEELSSLSGCALV